MLAEAKGEPKLAKSAWIVVYATGELDEHGKRKRFQQTFNKKKEADAWIARTQIDVLNGTHTPDAASITVREAGERWLKAAERDLERTSAEQYRQHLNHHILPYLGDLKLSRLTAAAVRDFETKLLEGTPPLRADDGQQQQQQRTRRGGRKAATGPRSNAMVKKIRVSLGAILADAQEQGLVARNVVSELRASRRRRGEKRQAKRHQRRKLQVGVDFPTPDQIKTILAAAQGRWRPFFLVAVFTGLRSSELRGLRWADVDLKRSELHVRQRADRYQEIGLPKSEAGERTVPLPEQVRDELQEWKAKCPPGKDGKVYVFPNTEGGIEWHANIINRAWWPIQIEVGVADVVKADGKVVLDKDCQPVRKARYGGLHTLRHFFASWCLARKVDYGLEAPLKTVQEWLGHASITMTADVYGHMLPRGDDSAERKEAASRILA